MLATAQRAIELACKQGADEAEAFVSHNFITTIRIASGRVVETKQVQEGGIGLRAAIGKKVGFSSANKLTKHLIERAVSAARARPANPDFNGFPEPENIKKVVGIYDRALEDLPRDRVTGLAEEMLQTALDFDKRVTDASGAINLVVECCAVANTNGVKASDRTTKIFGHLTAEAQGQDHSEGQGWQGSTTLRGFDPGVIGEQAAELAVNSLSSQRVKPGVYDVILEPPAAAELFYHVLAYALNGKDVYDCISYFTGYLNKAVTSSELDISDWGNMPFGLSSKTIDDEGSPTKKTSLVLQGKLLNFVYDHYYGGRARRQSTGNGLRPGDFGRSHLLEPTPHITNLVIAPRDLEHGELMENMQNGLLLSRIWYTYPITPQRGDFSTTSRCGFIIRNGEVQGAAKQVRIHENLPKLLKKVGGVGKKAENVIPWGASASVHTPCIHFHGVRIT